MPGEALEVAWPAGSAATLGAGRGVDRGEGRGVGYGVGRAWATALVLVVAGCEKTTRGSAVGLGEGAGDALEGPGAVSAREGKADAPSAGEGVGRAGSVADGARPAITADDDASDGAGIAAVTDGACSTATMTSGRSGQSRDV